MFTSFKSEAFNNAIPINLLQVQRISKMYQDYYNNYRPHQGIHGKIPNKPLQNPQSKIMFNKKEHLGGKVVFFEPNPADVA